MIEHAKCSLDVLFHRSRPSWLQLFFAAPFKTLAKTPYGYRSWHHPTKLLTTVTVACISDTHNQFPAIPDGDLLLHAGDPSQGGTLQEIQRTLDWLHNLPHQYKVVIARNHKLLLDPRKSFSDAERMLLNGHGLIYLQDSSRSLRLKDGRILHLCEVLGLENMAFGHLSICAE